MAILTDGFNTIISFPGAGVQFIEIEVTPPGADGGGEIDITGMRNVKWRQRTPKALITLTKMDVKSRWDPVLYTAVVTNLNVNRAIVTLFPSLTNTPARRLTWWGWLNKFEPEAMKEGEDPLANLEFIPSNTNAAGAEIAPVLT